MEKNLATTNQRNKRITEQAEPDWLLASMMHEIKNKLQHLMTAIENTTQILPACHLSQGYGLLQQAQHLNQELVAFLVIYKSAHHQLRAFIDYDDLYSLLEEELESFIPITSQQGIEIQLMEPTGEVLGFFDSLMVKQALSTAILNAMDYAKHKILLSCSATQSELSFTVEDDGPGYPADLVGTYTQENPFDLGELQVESSKGTALGLYFAFLVTQQHNQLNKSGALTLNQSKTLKGASFQISLPT